MTMDAAWPWLGLLALGAVHGINPGMGWLFAVALGLQERKRGAVWRALLPLAGGHALAIGCVALLAGAIGLMLPVSRLKWVVAAVLLAFGAYRLVRSGHPRWARMQVGAWDLTLWSFLMASAHGAGLMVLPVLLAMAPEAGGVPELHAAHGGHAAHAGGVAATLPQEQLAALAATAAHTAGYLLVTGVVAVVVYEKLGLRMLRSVWLNLDRVWAAALIVTAILTPLV